MQVVPRLVRETVAALLLGSFPSLLAVGEHTAQGGSPHAKSYRQLLEIKDGPQLTVSKDTEALCPATARNEALPTAQEWRSSSFSSQAHR